MHITFEEIEQRGIQLKNHFEEKLELDLSPGYETVQWIAGYINRNQPIFSEDKRYGWAIGFGYLLGESIIQVYGGEWEYRENDDQWGIAIIPLNVWANPIGKVYKHLENEADDITSFFEVIGKAIEKGGLDKLGS